MNAPANLQYVYQPHKRPMNIQLVYMMSKPVWHNLENAETNVDDVESPQT